MTQSEFFLGFLNNNRNAIIVGSLGTISRDLAEISHKHKFLIKGAMGCATGIGLGIALNTKKKVYVFIGDGALLMKMGSLATISKYAPSNLKIIILDNGCHDSCGGQPTNFRALLNEKIYSSSKRRSSKPND